MPPKPRKKKSSNTSLVPVLFTLGVIGWGFFAIERLTSPVNPDFKMASIEAHDLVENKDNSQKSWKQSAENFLSRFSKSRQMSETADVEFENWKAVETDDQEPSDQDSLHKDPQNISNTPDAEYLLYFYSDNGKSLSLVPVTYTIKDNFSLQNIFTEIINGPEKKNKSLIDSFPIKPTILDVTLKNQTLILNMDDNFGHGISFETAELQIQQLIKTASQFKNIKNLTFLINGAKIKTIQIDGLSLPASFVLH